MERQVYEEMRALERTHWWFTARREILAAEIAGLSLHQNSDILEVGCGTGGNLEMLSGFGRLQAVEPDADARRYAMERSGLQIHSGALPDGLPPLDRKFHLIAALDVIEHVDADRETVRALAGHLHPGGHLLVTVPAYQWMWSQHDVRHHHKRRYTAGEVTKLLDGAGLSIRRVSHFNTLLFPPIAAVRLANKVLGEKGGDDENLPAPWLNSVLYRAFAGERRLLAGADLPFGVSILAVATQPF
jgi:SAM-dependent methyltransferase